MRKFFPRQGRLSLLTLIAGTLLISGPAFGSLSFTPYFGTNITNDPNVGIIEATINSALSIYSSLFSNPINVAIYFDEGGGLGQSTFEAPPIAYSTYRTALLATDNSPDDTLAQNSVPNQATNPVNGSSSLSIKTANARAVGLSGTPSLAAGGHSNLDGIILLNTALTNLSRSGAQDSSKYDLQAVVMHEVDEILGLGSGLNLLSNPAPEDLFRYTGAGNGTRTYSDASNDAWFSIDGTTNLVQFHNVTGCNQANGDCGDWQNGAPVRVQDWQGTQGAQPNLSQVEIQALDVIGYTLISPAPEPGTISMMGGGFAALAGIAWRRRKRLSA